MNKLYFITGASGSGKTTAVKALEKEQSHNVAFFYFDSVGVPNDEEMRQRYGSGEGWQKATTLYWVREIKNTSLRNSLTILDGQMRLSFIKEACEQEGVTDYEIILFDCSDEERKRRLTERGNSELANDEMMNWARYLKQEAEAVSAHIIDTTSLTLDESVHALKTIMHV